MGAPVVPWVGGTELGCVTGPGVAEPELTEGAGAMLVGGTGAGAPGVVPVGGVPDATVGASGSSGASEGVAVVLGVVACVDVLEAGGPPGDRVLLGRARGGRAGVPEGPVLVPDLGDSGTLGV